MANLDQATLVLLVSVSLLLPHTVTAQETCLNGDLRFQSPVKVKSHTIEENLEYCWEGVWSGICGTERWGLAEARVACQQLGYDNSRYRVTCLGTNYTEFVVKINCPDSGPVSNLQKCVVRTSDPCACHSGVICELKCNENSTRLEGGSTDSEGRVEVCVDGRWGTVRTRQPRQVAEAVCGVEGLQYYTIYLGTQCGYRLSKPVYQCDVSDGGGLTCSEGDTDNHSMDLGVVCGPPLNNTESITICQEQLDNATIILVPVVLVLLLTAVTVIVVIIVVIVVRRRRSSNFKQRHNVCVSVPTHRNESYSLRELIDQMGDNATPTEPNNGSLGPGYDMSNSKSEEINTCHGVSQNTKTLSQALPVDPTPMRDESSEDDDLYDTDEQTYSVVEAKKKSKQHGNRDQTDQQQVEGTQNTECEAIKKDRETSKTQSEPVTPTPVRGEASRREDDFFDAEEHTYSVVNKNRNKT